YTYSVVPYLGEEAGEAAETTSAWVGYDTPKAPETVTAAETENGVEITFDEVTEGIHDGYIDPTKLVYIIKRNDDTLSDDCTSSPYTDETTDLPLALYTYSVAASDGENTSDFTAAPAIKLGDAIDLPYTPDLSDETARELFTISKNPTTDRDQWSWNSSKEAMECTASNATLITPQLNIQAGKIAVKWKATCWSSRYEEDFEILLCKNDDPDNLDVVSTIATPHVDTVSWPSEVTSEATVYDAGKYYIAFRQESNNWSLYLYQADVEQLTVTTGIDTVTSDNAAFAYDAENGTVTVPGAGHVTIHNIAGMTVVNTDTDGEAVATGNISAGIYVVTWTGDNGEKVVEKVVIR
ncbi:MAG: T9SS type A sorting domain-containing protein, partial [Duncaniella sp.]|nr:T9SS type A sorting domain-containing protein [Duncaniella sp.]